MILIDTSVWIDYLNGTLNDKTAVMEKCLDTEIVIVGDLILTEILQGITNENDAALVLKELSVRKTIDILIGTFCIENEIKLLHNDRDFEPMVKYLNLQVV